MEFFYLINQQYNRTALQLNEDGTVVGFEHNNSTAQQWTVTRSRDGKTVTIKNVRYKKYLNIKGKLANGVPLVGSDHKRDWEIRGSWPTLGLHILVQSTPFSPTLTGSANGTPVVLQNQTAGDNQEWLFRPPRLYFAYGSNLLQAQMDRLYKGNRFVGPAIIIGGRRWFVDNLGYVNIVRSPDDLVYGLVYEISLKNEDDMDISEGFPDLYTKETMRIELEVKGKKSLEQGLVYFDPKNLAEGKPTPEYIKLMNTALKDAVPRGIPQWYVDEYIHKFIPAE